MRISHLGHACVLLETESDRLLLDPGTFATGLEDLRDLTGILITHQHFDHVDEARLPALVAANPNVKLIIDEDTAELVVTKLGLPATVLRAGDAVTLGKTAVNVVGGRHAPIHPDWPTVSNNAYVVDHGAFYHPGDSLFVPEQAVDVLGAPLGGPWLKTSESIDFVRGVKPRVAVPIHEQTLAAHDLHHMLMTQGAPEGTAVTPLPRGEATEV